MNVMVNVIIDERTQLVWFSRVESKDSQLKYIKIKAIQCTLYMYMYIHYVPQISTPLLSCLKSVFPIHT